MFQDTLRQLMLPVPLWRLAGWPRAVIGRLTLGVTFHLHFYRDLTACLFADAISSEMGPFDSTTMENVIQRDS